MIGSSQNTDAVTKTVLYYDGRDLKSQEDSIIQEIPLKVLLNSRHVVSLACTGVHTDELAVGWLRSEGYIQEKDDIKEVRANEGRTTVDIITRNPVYAPFSKTVTVTSSGARSAAESTSLECIGESTLILSVSDIQRLMNDFIGQCRLHDLTGGSHGAALARRTGLIVVREDIGRHNAIDMLGGYALLNNLECNGMVIVRTGRASTEIVHKVWRLKVPILISISVPTTSAISEAETAGITLVGSVRRGNLKVYTHERRIHL